MFSLARIPVFLRVPATLVCLPMIDLHTPVMQLTTYLEKSYIFYLMQKRLSRRRDAEFSLGATVDKFTRFTSKQNYISHSHQRDNVRTLTSASKVLFLGIFFWLWTTEGWLRQLSHSLTLPASPLSQKHTHSFITKMLTLIHPLRCCCFRHP